jgi:hypothetical protein
MPSVRGEPAPAFDRACAFSANNEYRIETEAWAMRVPAANQVTPAEQSAGNDSASPQLYVKPDDWCEVNEVSDRCPEIVEKMQAALAEFGQACEAGQGTPQSMLPQELVLGLE